LDLRNIAIIAHVDHGKTTLVDEMLAQAGVFREHQRVVERVMDSGDLERERGITILAKNTAIRYNGVKINIVDTPGHADFSGEVERILKMVSGVLLLVDAVEGPMPQTRFVLNRALELGHKVIIVINKIDKPEARIYEVVDEVLELLMDLDATDEQLDSPILFCSGRTGTASLAPEDAGSDLIPLFDMIISHIPEPEVTPEGPGQMLVSAIDYNDYVGRIGIGVVLSKSLKLGETVTCLRLDGSSINFRIQKLFLYLGLSKSEVSEVETGDICGICGLSDINVGDTITNIGYEYRLPEIKIDEPTIKIDLLTNTSPLVGTEGKWVTASKIEERLIKETKRDVALKIMRIDNSETWTIYARGELHLSILIENMRREGFEFSLSRPSVVLKNIDGQIHEPYEELQIDINIDSLGEVMNLLSERKGSLLSMHQTQNNARLSYIIPARGLIGLQTIFLSITKGYGILNHSFFGFKPMQTQNIAMRTNGTMISINSGIVTTYALLHLEDRGDLFVDPKTLVYEGMIVGINNKNVDLNVNVTIEKQLTNVRSSTKENTIILKKRIEMPLEKCMSFINEDELIEVTPKNIRLRKIILGKNERKKYNKYNKEIDE